MRRAKDRAWVDADEAAQSSGPGFGKEGVLVDAGVVHERIERSVVGDDLVQAEIVRSRPRGEDGARFGGKRLPSASSRSTNTTRAFACERADDRRAIPFAAAVTNAERPENFWLICR